jgi:Peptidase inhibitor family I36
MIQIRGKAFAALISVLALGVAIAVPGFAVAEEQTAPAAPPSGEATVLDESCPSGSICVWTQTNYQGARGQTACSATGFHPLGGWKYSVKNRCANKGAGLMRDGQVYGCVPPGGQNPSPIAFNGVQVYAGNPC